MNIDAWAIKYNIDRSAVHGIDPMERIKWALQILDGTIVKIIELDPKKPRYYEPLSFNQPWALKE